MNARVPQHAQGILSVGAARKAYALLTLTSVFTLNCADRSLLAITIEPIKREFALTDTQAGFLSGMAFSIIYVFVCLPLGALSDRVNRRNLLAGFCALWSILTMVCAGAQTYVQLVFARMMVGAAEAAGPPAGLSMISDIFPKEQRARAISIYYLSIPLGLCLVYILGAWVTETYGWREAFLVMGAPGLLLAMVLILTVREPQRGATDPSVDRSKALFGEFMRVVRGRRSIVHLLVALTIATIVKSGESAFLAAFLMRSHGYTIQEAGVMLGVMFAAIGAIGILGGGFLADWLGRVDERWRSRVAAGSLVLCLPLLTVILMTSSRPLIAFAVACWAVLSNVWIAPTYSLLQSLVSAHMRARMGAVQFLLAGAVAYSLGPLLLGALSDVLSPVYGRDSLRYAMLVLTLALAWACVHFVLAERNLRGDLKLAIAT